jgi:SHS2 domain-containing protein
VELRGSSREELLVDWVNELIFRVWGEGWVPADVRIESCGSRRVRAVLAGPRLAAGGLAKEVKAASYHGLRVDRRRGRWTATLILDV